MAVLSRFFVVDSTAAAVEATGITDIEVQSLDTIVTGAVDRFLDDVDTEDDAVVFVLPQPLVAALAATDTTALRLVAIQWAQTEELADSDADVLFDLVLELSALAKLARTAQRDIHLRIEG